MKTCTRGEGDGGGDGVGGHIFIKLNLFISVRLLHCLTHLHPVVSSTTTVWPSLFPIAGCLFSYYYHYALKFYIPVVHANSVDHDQMPHSAASDLFHANSVDPNQMAHSTASNLSLHCLSIALLGASRLKAVKYDLLDKTATFSAGFFSSNAMAQKNAFQKRCALE